MKQPNPNHSNIQMPNNHLNQGGNRMATSNLQTDLTHRTIYRLLGKLSNLPPHGF